MLYMFFMKLRQPVHRRKFDLAVLNSWGWSGGAMVLVKIPGPGALQFGLWLGKGLLRLQ